MKLTIFGASGRTGRPLVEQALAAGHHVTALVRDPAKLPVQHQNLRIVRGDALSAPDVDQAIAGADAVISALGHTKGSPPDLQTVATRQIIAAMQRHGVRRLISLTGAAVPAPEDQPKLFNHFISFVMQTVAGTVLNDAKAHAALINASDLDWTIVRGPMLVEAPYTGRYRVGWVGVNTGARIPYPDLADFMLKQVTDTTYLRKAPMVSS